MDDSPPLLGGSELSAAGEFTALDSLDTSPLGRLDVDSLVVGLDSADTDSLGATDSLLVLSVETGSLIGVDSLLESGSLLEADSLLGAISLLGVGAGGVVSSTIAVNVFAPLTAKAVQLN